MTPKTSETTIKTTADVVVTLSNPSSNPLGVPKSRAAPPMPPSPSPFAVCKRTVMTTESADNICKSIKKVFMRYYLNIRGLVVKKKWR